MMYEGKEVWTQENFSYQDVKIGDYVEQAVVDDAMDCLPPACMTSRCSPDGRAVFPPGGPGNRGVEGHLRHLQESWRRVAERHLAVLRPLFPW